MKVVLSKVVLCVSLRLGVSAVALFGEHDRTVEVEYHK